VTDDSISVSDVDDGLSDTLSDLINEFNVEATGLDDGRALSVVRRGPDGSLEAGLTGWTWGGCGFIQYLWVRADVRRAGLGSRLLLAAEAEAIARGCSQMVLSSHTFQAPDFYKQHGYTEVARTEEYPRGHAEVHLIKMLPPAIRGEQH
jgi:ribosomal protein S18 acetylase RimI-like enzyme